MTLEEYFRQNGNEHVVMSFIDDKDRVTFYMHPYDTDGDTLDFEVKGNALVPLKLTENKGEKI